MMETPETKRSEKLLIQTRDMDIFKFLDRVGYAAVKQITMAVSGYSGEKAEAAILRRLYLLRRFEYLKVFSTHRGNYYALDSRAIGDNPLISGIRLGELDHHDFLIELFLLVRNEPIVLSEREALAKYKSIGKNGKIPDMVVNDWIIEFERTSKSVADSKSVVEYWTGEHGKNLCVIYETDEIKNRYTTFINPRVRLLSRSNYMDVLRITQIDGAVDIASGVQGLDNHRADDYQEDIRSKYL